MFNFLILLKSLPNLKFVRSSMGEYLRSLGYALYFPQLDMTNLT